MKHRIWHGPYIVVKPKRHEGPGMKQTEVKRLSVCVLTFVLRLGWCDLFDFADLSRFADLLHDPRVDLLQFAVAVHHLVLPVLAHDALQLGRTVHANADG